MSQSLAIFDPNNRFFYDDLLDLCIGSHTREEVNQAISASVAFTTTKSGMWIRKKEAPNGSIYFEFAPDLKGISPKHKVKIRSGDNDDDESTSTMSVKLKDLLLQASIKKIRYTDVNFMPLPPGVSQTRSKFFNLFLGFLAQPALEINKGLINPILRHLLEVWCDGNKELATYVANWLAFLVQKPDKKPGTALLMRSPPRCGKNILTDFIGEKVLGRENFFSTTRLHDVMGRFNGIIRAKKLIVLNECDMTGSEWHGANNQLKGLITEPYVTIEEKGIDTKHINDFAGYMILSNHAMPIRIELGDERFVALDVSARYKGNRKYFTELARLTEHPDTASSFMAWLLSRNITDWNPRDVPNTKMKQDLIEASMPNPQRFMLEYIDIYWPENGENIQEISCKKFYEIYTQWCQDNGESKMLSSNKFGMEIKQFVIKTRPRSENRIPHYKLDRKMIIEKFNESLGKSTSALIDNKEVIADAQSEKKEVVVEPKITSSSPKPVSKKVPPPIPPKPNRLKVSINSSDKKLDTKKPLSITMDDLLGELQNFIEGTKEIDPASISLPESPKIEAVIAEPIPAVTPEPEPYGIPGPSNTSAPEPEPIQERAQDENLEILYKSAKGYWESDGNDPEEFDWEILAIEIENLSDSSNFGSYNFSMSLIMAMSDYRYKVNGRYIAEIQPTDAEIAQKIREYAEEKGDILPEGYIAVEIERIPCYNQINKEEYGDNSDSSEGEDFSDDDEEFYNKAGNVHKIVLKK